MKLACLIGCLLLGLACGTKPAEAPAPAPASLPLAGLQPWSWHPLGGLAVIEGEVPEATDLTLKGRSVEEHRYAEQGPVRWELFRPPDGETAVLLDGAGKELARFTFSAHPPPPPASKAQPLRSPSAPRPSSEAKAMPVPPSPAVNRAAHLDISRVGPLASRRGGSVSPTPRETPTFIPRPYAPPVLDLPKPAPPELSLPPVKSAARMDTRRLSALASRRDSSVSSVPGETPTYIPRPYAPPVLHLPEPTPLAPFVLPPSGQAGAWPGAGEALNLTRGRSGHKQILLSFDGGSNAEVANAVLDLLKARGVHTTLFLTGAFIQKFPAIVRRMAAEGHELGNHTMNHPHFAPGMKRDPRWTKERIQKELLDADAALVKLLGRPMDPFWRAPYGEHTAEIRRWAEELGYRHVGWSEGADTLDWATPKQRGLYRSGNAIVQRLEKRLNQDGDGLIVLMHLGSERVEGDRPTEELGAFMDRASRAGWTFVKASTFVQELGKPAWDGRRRMAILAARPQSLAAK